MSVRDALARVDAIVAQTAPKSATSHSFKVLDEHQASGAVDGQTGTLRQCSVVAVTTPADDGMAGAGGLRKRMGCELRVRYDYASISSRRDLDVMVGEDVDALIDSLRITSTNVALTGLDGVVIDAEDALRQDIQTGEQPPVAVLVIIPFSILYHEEV